MRRTHLRFHYNIAKRMLIHVAGFNLGLLMRKRFGVGTPRGLQGRLAGLAALMAALALLLEVVDWSGFSFNDEPSPPTSPHVPPPSRIGRPPGAGFPATCTTGC